MEANTSSYVAKFGSSVAPIEKLVDASMQQNPIFRFRRRIGGEKQTNVKLEVGSNDAKNASVVKVDIKFELVVIPVAMLNRANRVPWEARVAPRRRLRRRRRHRAIQFTPLVRAGAIFRGDRYCGGTRLGPRPKPGSVPTSSCCKELLDRGVEISEDFMMRPRTLVLTKPTCSAAARECCPSRASQLPLPASFRDPDGKVMAAPGRDHPGHAGSDQPCDRTTFASANYCECTSARRRPRPAREAHWRCRSELADLVRRVHGARGVRRRAADE